MCAQAAFSGKGNKALDNGVASTAGAFDNILMNGQEVFKFAVRAVPTARPGNPCNPGFFLVHTMTVYCLLSTDHYRVPVSGFLCISD